MLNRFRGKWQKIFDSCILIILIVIIMYSTYTIFNNSFIKNKKKGDIVKDYETIGTIELATAKYFNAIDEESYKVVNDMLCIDNKKNKKDISSIKEKMTINGDWIIRANKVIRIEKNIYSCNIIKMKYGDTSDFKQANIIIRLYPETKTFYVISEEYLMYNKGV